MASLLQDENEDITGINVTPLVDVMLVLLIIFMVTTSYIVTNAIDIKLPQEESGEVQAADENAFVFELTREGQLTLHGKPVSWEEIPGRIARYKASTPGGQQALQALISADKLVPHGLVMNLIDIIRKNGINNFAISVEAPAKPTSN